MANRWGNNGNSNRLNFLGLQNHCRWWLQPWNYKTLVSWQESYDKPRQGIKKQRHHFANKDPYSYGFYSDHIWCESWTIKKAEHRRTDAFELWCQRRPLRVLWTARRSNQSILKEISPGCSLEGISLKLKLQYFGQLMQRANSLERTWSWERLRAKREEGGRGKYSITDSMDMSFSKLQELVKDREDWHVL